MRLPFQAQPCLTDTPVSKVVLNTNCRDEIIPILRGLQHIYEVPQLRREILDCVGRDVNAHSSRKLGRRGMDYWQIVVLASVRLGCNLNYDKLQDLAEQHRALRQIMGISNWDLDDRFDWRRIEDNVCLLRPETVEKLNHLIVAAGHRLVPEAIERVRGDTFVVETNIHYPTDSSLVADGLRKVVTLSKELAATYGIFGWRQSTHWLKQIKEQARQASQAARSKGKQAGKRLMEAYRILLATAAELLGRARALLLQVGLDALAGGSAALDIFVQRTERVCDIARRRVLLGENVPVQDKLFSIFEEHTELFQRGKARTPVQFGHSVLVIEDAAGFVCHYEVLRNGTLDQDVVVPSMKKLQKRMQGKVREASFDRAFHTPENQEELAKIVSSPCIAPKGQSPAASGDTVAYRQARKSHPGVESAIGALQAGNGLERCRDRSYRGYQRYVGLGVLGRNLQVLGKLLLAAEDKQCRASQSKRKKRAG